VLVIDLYVRVVCKVKYHEKDGELFDKGDNREDDSDDLGVGLLVDCQALGKGGECYYVED
jgi:hypothetical protein